MPNNTMIHEEWKLMFPNKCFKGKGLLFQKDFVYYWCIPEKQICGGLWTLQGSNWLKVRRKGRGYVRKNRSTELEGVHSWVLPLLFKKISASPSASASILFSRAPSCCANEVKSDLPAHFLAPYLVMVWHAEKLTACAVLEMRSYNT